MALPPEDPIPTNSHPQSTAHTQKHNENLQHYRVWAADYSFLQEILSSLSETATEVEIKDAAYSSIGTLLSKQGKSSLPFVSEVMLMEFQRLRL